MLLVVMYHYIREVDSSKPGSGIYPVMPSGLERQLDLLSEHFRFISLSELIDMKRNGSARISKENLCLITLDDGLREQYETAWMILKAKHIPAIFFACAKPFLDGKLLRVHRIHYVRSVIKHADLQDAFTSLFQGKHAKELKDISAETLKLTYRYDSPDEAYLKYLLNYVLSEREVDEFLDYVYEKFKLNYQARDLYLSERHLIELAKYDAIGSHALSHRPLSQLDPADAAYELKESKKVLERITGRRILAVSYPYGGLSAVTKGVANIAESAGYEIGFTAERSFNTSLAEPLLLARADTNDAIGGKSPQFEYSGAELRITGNFGLCRRQWVTE